MVEGQKDLQEDRVGINEISEVIGDRVFIPEVVDALKIQQHKVLMETEYTMPLQGQCDGMRGNSTLPYTK
jgi:hypothetical protein